MALKKSLRIAVVVSSLLCLILGFLSYSRLMAISETNYVSAVWIGGAERVWKVSTESGASLLNFHVKRTVRALGIDEWNERVWILSDRALYSYAFDGTRVLAIPLTGKLDGCGIGEGGRFSLAVDSADGSVFVPMNEKILRFTPDGVLQKSIELQHDVEGVAFDPVNSLLFAVARKKVHSFDEAGNLLGSVSLGGHARTVDMASSSGDLYVALEDSIVKYTHDLSAVSEVGLRNVKRIAPDAAGLWATTGRTLHRLDSSLAVQFQKNLHEEIVDLVSDGITCWVMGKKKLYHIGQGGDVLLSVKAHPHGEARTIALYRDSIAPTVGIVSPANGAYLNTQSPSVELSLSDAGSGVNSSTISFVANGSSISSSCTEKTGGAVCTFGALLPEGANSLAVTVKDGEGNASSPSQTSFAVDVTPPVITVSSPENGLVTNQAAQSLAGSVNEPGTLTVNGETVSLDGSYRFTKSATLMEGANTFHIVASDLAGNTAAVDLGATLDTVVPGIAVGSLVTVGRSVDGEAAVTGAAGSVEANAWVVVTNVRTGETFSALSGTDGSFSIKISAASGDALSITVRDAAGNTGGGLSVNVANSAAADSIPAGSFGDTYRDLVPADATVTSYDSKRLAIVTGLVWDESGSPLPGVTVSILLHPEYGTARTGSDGRFSIPVEGGGTLTVAFQKSGLIGAQRQAQVPWNGIAATETVRMIVADSASTVVTFDGNSSTAIIHRSTEVTDSSGKRSCTLVFSGDTRAYSVDASGNVLAELTSMTTRATEFKTPDSMPAILPPNSAFTYCAELAVDGVDRVTFTKPVTVWVENFLGFPVGTTVPVGYYDRDKGAWVPSDSGVTVKLLDTDGDGIADAVDATGDGIADDLNGNGSLSDEAAGLGDPAKYPPGAIFWRFAVTHFTWWDSNWAFAPPSSAIYPNSAPPKTDQQQPEQRSCPLRLNSYVEERSRILHEDLPIPGTGMTLHYASNRVGGYKHQIAVPASGDSVPASLKKIVARVEVAGRTFEEELDPLPNQQKVVEWDGLDPLGRRVIGPTTAHISVGYVYGGVYQKTSRFGYNGGGTIEGSLTRQEVTLWSKSDVVVECGSGEGQNSIAEGWSLSAHHYLSPMDAATLLKGDGTKQERTAGIVTTVAGTGTAGYGGDGGPGTQAMLSLPYRATAHPSGDVYIADPGNNRIRKLDTNGIITTVAGAGAEAHSGDGGPAVAANVSSPQKVAFDPAGNMYIAETHAGCVRKVDVNGIISTVVCNVDWPDTVAADAAGNVYIGEQYANRVRKVDPNGNMTTIISGGFGNITDLAVDPSGNLFIADRFGCRVMKMDASGNLTKVAGNGSGYSGDGGPAVSARMSNIFGIATNASGELFIGDHGNGSVRKVDKFGNITTVAGTGAWGNDADGGLATRTKLPGAFGVAVDSAGNLYIVEPDARRVRKVAPSSSVRGVGEGELAFAEENGLGHIFSSAGYHKKTIDLNTGAVLASFEYDANNKLVSLTDRFGNVTRIARDGNGIATAIVSPDGVTTVLTTDGNGRLTSVQYGDGGNNLLEYSADGLLLAKVDGNGNRFEHTFDSMGRLLQESDQEGGAWTFSRSVAASGQIRTERLTAEGNLTSYQDFTDSTGAYTSTITDPSGAATVFYQSADGLKATKSLSCGKSLAFEYGADPEYKYAFVKQATMATPSGLTKTTSLGKAYSDSNGDGASDRITLTQTVNGNVSTVVDDTLAGTRTTTSPLGRATLVNYDPASLLTTSVAVSGLYNRTFGYDARGRLSSVGIGARQWTTAYDSSGNVSSMTDPENRTTAYGYDAVGRLTGMVRPDGTSLGFSYDLNGNVTVLSTPSGISHGFGYNRVNLDAAYAAPLSGSYAVTYDRERKLKTVKFPSGKEIENVYEKGLLKQTVTPEGTIDYAYLCSNKVGSVVAGAESVSFGYDGPLVTSETLSGTLSAALGYAYDNNFRPTQFTYAGGSVNFAYDVDGLLTQSGAFAIGRNASNGLATSVSGGPLSISRAFNGYGELDGETFRVNGLDSHSRTVSRSDSGRILSRTEAVGGSSVETTWTYDELGRLLTASRDGTMVEEYGYDANGNRTYERNLLRGIERTPSYSDEDHLRTAGDATYEYDADGFLTTVIKGSQTTRYSYSSRGELLSVTLPSGDLIEYVHDPFGRRIAKKLNGSVTEKYLWQGISRLLAVYDGSDNLLMRFQYADARVPFAMTRDGATYYLAYDQVGTPVAVFDASGNAVKQIDRDSFGNILSDSDPTFALPVGFAGGLYDPDTGLVRFGYRDYDPDTGRWTAKDPIRFAGGDTNLYGYCLSDPVNLADPYGLISRGKLVVGTAIVIVGAAALVTAPALSLYLVFAEHVLNVAAPACFLVTAHTAGVALPMVWAGIGFVYAGGQMIFDEYDEEEEATSCDSSFNQNRNPVPGMYPIGDGLYYYDPWGDFY